jgi:hypothetical protein
MAKLSDGTKAPHHVLFYMENSGGHNEENVEPVAAATPADERQASCFAWEDEKGEDWKGSGAMKSEIKDKRPSL